MGRPLTPQLLRYAHWLPAAYVNAPKASPKAALPPQQQRQALLQKKGGGLCG